MIVSYWMEYGEDDGLVDASALVAPAAAERSCGSRMLPDIHRHGMTLHPASQTRRSTIC
jgi:hypothetical protein